MKSVENLIRTVFSNPTAPYRENWVLDCVKRELVRLRVPYFEDAWGNVIAGAKGPAELKRSRKVALMAHTDHPGFHIDKKLRDGFWSATWFGGCPPKIHGAKVAVHHPSHPETAMRGKIVSRKLEGSSRVFKIKIENDERCDNQCFGAFDFEGSKFKGHRVYTRAADDLTGVVIILATFERLKPAERRHMLGIFTRAEEVGFRGALGIIYRRLLGPQNSIISLEASRQLPGARIGHGPVIRLGDKRTLFDSVVTSRLDQASDHLSKRSPKFKTQRRIMNGGTCEATPFNLHNIKASGIAVPLGNYHNQRPSGAPGPEFIDARDVEAAVNLCVEFFRHTEKKMDPIHDFLVKLEKDFKKDSAMLLKRLKFRERTL